MPRRLPALGVAAVVAGFAVILAAWLGARDRAYIDQQFPALVAGGVAGLALVVLGAAALVVDAHRRASDRLAGQLGEAVAAATRNQSAAGSPADTEVAVSTTVARNGSGNGNGNGNRHHDGKPDSTSVVPRRTLFHDPECRLVSARTDTETVGRSDAVAAGLAACRVCRP